MPTDPEPVRDHDDALDREDDPRAMSGAALTPDEAAAHGARRRGPEPVESTVDEAQAAADGLGEGPGEEPKDRFLGGDPEDADTPSRELADADVWGDRTYRIGG